MEVIEISHQKIPALVPSACCVGYFDGLHKGHQLLLDKTLETAEKHGLASGVILFDPDPWTIFHPEQELDYLTPLPKRLEMIGQKGFDLIYILRFTKEFAALPVEAFHDVLVQMHVRYLICGTEFKYACRNTGSIETLKNDRRLHAVPVDLYMEDPSHKISSSTIEEYVLEGKIALANELLGYMYSLDGTVEKGYQRGGRLLGFPTANLRVAPDVIVPAAGVYAGYVKIGDRYHMAMINVGSNPTFNNTKRTIEAHILDFDQDIYGEKVRFLFAHYIRGEQKFPSVQALKEQLHRDIMSTRSILSKNSVKDKRFVIMVKEKVIIMAKEFIQLSSKDDLGTVSLNKSVFSTIAANVVEEVDHVEIFESSKPFKNGITTRIEDNKLFLNIPVKIDYNANVTDVCANLQNKIFESISYMTDHKPEEIQIDVVGFIF